MNQPKPQHLHRSQVKKLKSNSAIEEENIMDAENTVEISALTTDEAILIGLTRLAATRDEVKIEILDEGSRGFLGLGTKMAMVRITRIDTEKEKIVSSRTDIGESLINTESPQVQTEIVEIAENDAEIVDEEQEIDKSEQENIKIDQTPSLEVQQVAKTISQKDVDLRKQKVEDAVNETAEQLLSSLSLAFSMEWREEEDRPTLWISFYGSDADSIVGPHAQTLNSVQYLFRTLVHRQVPGNYNLVVDADGYRQRRRRSLVNLARKNAEQAVQSGRTIRLRSMPAHERRIIHILLRDDERVTTRSVGTGRNRAITIIPNTPSE
jgi:spoIIIJ-associated protein